MTTDTLIACLLLALTIIGVTMTAAYIATSRARRKAQAIADSNAYLLGREKQETKSLREFIDTLTRSQEQEIAREQRLARQSRDEMCGELVQRDQIIFALTGMATHEVIGRIRQERERRESAHLSMTALVASVLPQYVQA